MSISKYFKFDTRDGSYEELKTKSTFKNLYKGVRIPWVRIIIGAFLGVFNVLVLMTQYDNYMAIYQGNLTDLSPLFGYLTAIFIQYVLIFITVISDRALVEMVTGVSKKIWRKLMHLPVREFETSKPGSMLSRITIDAQYASKPFEAVVAFLQGIVTVVTLSAVVPENIGYAVPWLIFALLFGIALAAYTAIVLSRSTLYMQNKKAEQTDHYNELLGNIRFVKASNAEEKAIRVSDEYIEKRYDAALYQAHYKGLIELVNNYSNLVMALCFGASIFAIASGIVKDIEPISAIYAFLFAVGAVIVGFMGFPTYFSEAVGGTRKIASVLEKGEEDIESGAALEGADKNIALENVSFAYAAADTLRDLTVTIPAGETTAIVGNNGSGKSTLIKILSRLYPAKDGDIRIGEADAKDTSLGSWRNSFSVVSQKTELFAGTLKSNLIYGREDCSEEELQNAVHIAGLDELVAEKGFDFELGIKGLGLSGGEAQRVSIARAVLKNSDILILDEATANLDAATEKTIRDGLAEFMKGRTVIVIAHDFAAVENADNILVMRDGRIEDFGRKEEMLQRNPYMKLMVEG